MLSVAFQVQTYEMMHTVYQLDFEVSFFGGIIYLLTKYLFFILFLGCKQRVAHSNPNKIYPRIDEPKLLYKNLPDSEL